MLHTDNPSIALSSAKEKIKDTAKYLLFTEGRFSATTQQIAQIAHTDRTAIHYYFRTRTNLVRTIIDEIINEFPAPSWEDIRDLPLKEKLIRYISYNTEKSKKYPYLDIYIITQQEFEGCTEKLFFPWLEMIPEILLCIHDGSIRYNNPVEFLADLISIVSGYHIAAVYLQNRSDVILSPTLHDRRTERIINFFLQSM
ncbi:TetR/AcrR family transcriptional regulator [Chryseobacterium tongliaoense]|uniref:TetR/AcrR family transcriptional regulator n=1 Tax=Chryseobacterium tongliaoense TaxID=3240933 RepID=UPI0035112625